MATNIFWKKNSQTKNAYQSKHSQNKKLSNTINGFALVESTLWMLMLVVIIATTLKLHLHIEKANIHLLQTSKKSWKKLERKYAKEK